jgi:hypothetical protein
MKVAINTSYGGFDLSAAGVKRYAELKGTTAYFFTAREDEKYNPISFERAEEEPWFTAFTIPDPKSIDENKLWNECYIGRNWNRTEKELIQVIEELGKKASGQHSDLAIVEVPDDVKWHISEYDGIEWIAEDHRCWDQDGEYGKE